MMKNEKKPIKIISKEDAVFRLDGNGVWHNTNEKFTNQKIINYFHSVIKKDGDGFFLEQDHKHYIEKVYFQYEDTPLFVFHIIKRDGLVLRLNTGETVRLDPEKLLVKNDNLYIQNDKNLIKFNDNALFSITDYLDDVDGQYFINIDGKRHAISGME